LRFWLQQARSLDILQFAFCNLHFAIFSSPMASKIYINGKLYDKADAKVSVYDHGFLYGDGVFEGIRVYDGKVFRLREHVDRLYDSARAILLEIPMSRDKMAEAITSTVKANDKKDGYIRAVV